jgi:hypothetical protein
MAYEANTDINLFQEKKQEEIWFNETNKNPEIYMIQHSSFEN